MSLWVLVLIPRWVIVVSVAPVSGEAAVKAASPTSHVSSETPTTLERLLRLVEGCSNRLVNHLLRIC